MAEELDRTALYELVWSVPLRELAKRYGISDVALKKKCKAASIPAPPRGHWANKAAGRRTVQPPLPLRAPGQSEKVSFGDRSRWYGRHESDDELLALVPQPPHFEEPLDAVRDRIVKLVGRVPQPRGLDQPLRLIAGLLAADEERRIKAAKSSYSWDRPLFDSLFERRRLRLLNAILTALERAGARPTMRGNEGRRLSVRIGDCTLEWELDEPAYVGRPAHETYRPEIGETEPGTPLKLQIGSWMLPEGFVRSWQDTKDRKLEAQLTDIVVQIVLAAEVRHRTAAQSGYEWKLQRQAQIREERRRKQEEAERKERERQAKLAQARIDRLLRDAEDYRRANDIRMYVGTILAKTAGDAAPADEAAQRWAAWARDQADRLDPTTSGQYIRAIAADEDDERRK